MGNACCLESIFSTGKEVDKSLFPCLTDEEYDYMDDVLASDSPAVHVFPFVREAGGKLKYIEVVVRDYTYDDLTGECRYSREHFMICEELRMSEEDEKKFLTYIRRASVVDRSLFEKMNQSIAKLFPQWRYKGYPITQSRKAFEHLYFASHPSGGRDILYRAGLENIAFNLKRVTEYNPMGTNVEEVLGCAMPDKLLRILNQPQVLPFLFYKWSVDRCVSTYWSFVDVIGTMIPSPAQWEYLVALGERKEGTFCGFPFIRALYSRLAGVDDLDVLDCYRRYLFILRIWVDRFNMRIRTFTLPSLANIDELVSELDYLEDRGYLDCGPYWEILTEWSDSWNYKFFTSKVKDRSSCDRERLEYSDSMYLIQMPDSVLSFYMETLANGVNIIRYINRHAYRAIDVLFIRKQNDPDKPYAEIVICDGVITEIHEKGQSIPSDSLMGFVRRYAAEKGFELENDGDGTEKVECE